MIGAADYILEAYGHDLIEVVPPRVYGGGGPKLAVECRLCKRRQLVRADDVRRVFGYPCPGTRRIAPLPGHT